MCFSVSALADRSGSSSASTACAPWVADMPRGSGPAMLAGGPLRGTAAQGVVSGGEGCPLNADTHRAEYSLNIRHIFRQILPLDTGSICHRRFPWYNPRPRKRKGEEGEV